MTTRRQVMNALARIGATLEEDHGEWHLYLIDAPAGSVWRSTETHVIVSQHDPLHERMGDLWSSLLEDIRQGVQDCNGWQDQLEQEGLCETCQWDGLIETPVSINKWDCEIKEDAR